MQQQTLTQYINIAVDTASGSQAGAASGSAGADAGAQLVGATSGGSLADTGVSALSILAISMALIAVSLAIFMAVRRGRSRRGGIFGSFLLALLASSSLTMMAVGQSTTSAAVVLNVLGEESITITVPEGGGTAATTTKLTTRTQSEHGYKLSAVLSEDEPGIGVKLSGGQVAQPAELKLNANPVTLKETSVANQANTFDETKVTLEFTVDDTVVPGQKKLAINYHVTDNPIPTPTTMQTMTKAYCDTMPIYTGANPDAILKLKDPRGNTEAEHQTYEVARLADGNCWMLNNLKLGSASGDLALTPDNTNTAQNFTLPQLTTAGTISYDSPRAYGPVSGDSGAGATNYGYLYNWPAATTGESRTTMPEGSGDAKFSICPANWRLPLSGSEANSAGQFGRVGTATNEFDILNAKMAGYDTNLDLDYQSKRRTFYQNWQHEGPIKGVYSGIWWNGFHHQSSQGRIWSSSTSPDNANLVYHADLGVDTIEPGTFFAHRANGYAIRCLLGEL